jgi:hypothetical protein
MGSVRTEGQDGKFKEVHDGKFTRDKMGRFKEAGGGYPSLQRKGR